MMILAMMMVMTISANAMSYNAAKNEALFLSDKMAYELNLTAAQYEAVYEINLDYLMSLNGNADIFGIGGIAAMQTSASCWTPGSSTSMWHSPTSIVLWLGMQVVGHSQCTLTMTEAVSSTHTRRCS